MRHGAHGEHVVLIGIIKKSLMEKEELVVEPFLRAGFNRVSIILNLFNLLCTLEADLPAALSEKFGWKSFFFAHVAFIFCLAFGG